MFFKVATEYPVISDARLYVSLHCRSPEFSHSIFRLGCKVDWVAVTTFLSCVVLGVSAYFIYGQIVAVRQAMYAQSLSAATNLMDDEVAHRMTADLFQRDGQTPRPQGAQFFTGLTPGIHGAITMSREEGASILCSRYDAVGAMVRYKMLPEEVVLSTRGSTIVTLWRILAPHVSERRRVENNPSKWRDFEMLAGRAERWQ